jgi:multiple sugar transport system ATP-binding protein
VKDDEAVVVGRFGARSRVKVGEEVTAVVDTRALHFFDPETGMGIYDGTNPSKGAPS